MKIKKLIYRGLGLEQDIDKNVKRLAKKEHRKINPMINILLREAISKRKISR